MTYSEKLKNPKWQKKRLEILERDKFACRMCFNDQAELHVHHRKYSKGKEPWDYEDSNFVTLCAGCHESVEMLNCELLYFSCESNFHYDALVQVMKCLNFGMERELGQTACSIGEVFIKAWTMGVNKGKEQCPKDS